MTLEQRVAMEEWIAAVNHQRLPKATVMAARAARKKELGAREKLYELFKDMG